MRRLQVLTDLIEDVNYLLLILIPESGGCPAEINAMYVSVGVYLCSLRCLTIAGAHSQMHTNAPTAHKGSYEMTSLN